MTNEELVIELLKWMGGGGVALVGVFLTSKKNKTDRHVGIINDLQEENKRKDDRLDTQDEKIQILMDQMDEMRRDMFEIQTDKHRSELKNIELQSKNERLEEQKEDMSEKIKLITKEKNEIKERLEARLIEIETELNTRIDLLIEENKELRERIEKIINENNHND